MLLDTHTNLVDKQGRFVVCPVSTSSSDSDLCPFYITFDLWVRSPFTAIHNLPVVECEVCMWSIIVRYTFKYLKFMLLIDCISEQNNVLLTQFRSIWHLYLLITLLKSFILSLIPNWCSFEVLGIRLKNLLFNYFFFLQIWPFTYSAVYTVKYLFNFLHNDELQH